MTEKNIRLTVDLKGILQGVGFRPTMARLADEDSLGGWVRNQAGTVRLCLEGGAGAVDRFVETLAQRLPRQARLDALDVVERVGLDVIPAVDFEILESDGADATRVSIPADLRMCPDCMNEVLDPQSRYYNYPFTTCTNCGPRYTVVDGMPYDRERTALKEFPLCGACNKEYTKQTDRRFHAESIACPSCGPRLFLADGDGNIMDVNDPMLGARRALKDGKILAVRGLGGYLLAADAYNEETLLRLRERKSRPHKPFAVMTRNEDVAKSYCHLPDSMAQSMNGAVGPIAILDLKRDSGDARALPMEQLAPCTGTLGVMLPTTPLHLLLAGVDPSSEVPPFDVLVMTSGNRGGEPICISNPEAFERLSGIADLFLCHDREINLRNDDSLVANMAEQPQVWRRARGFAPSSVRIKKDLERVVLACGSELKNTIALGFGDEIVLSPHIGDLETPQALDGLAEVVEKFPEYFRQTPAVVAVDLHPDMHSTSTGRRYAELNGVEVEAVQHHHAHGAACMAEHGLDESLAIVFDGTGYGTDGTIWGAELLHLDGREFDCLGTFAGVPLPGGDAAVREPIRQLVARWIAADNQLSDEWKDRLQLTQQQLKTWRLQCEKGLNAPVTHAAGRVFDAFAAALGGPELKVTYEGLAAIWLENMAAHEGDINEVREVSFDTREGDLFVVDFAPAFTEICDHPPGAKERGPLARGFHQAVIHAAVAMAQNGRERTGQSRVVLSGGVMMNRIVCEGVIASLRNDHFEVFVHRDVPPNDGGIALGQAWIVGGKK